MKKNKFSVICSPSFKRSRIRFLPFLKDAIGFMKTRAIDAVVLYEK